MPEDSQPLNLPIDPNDTELNFDDFKIEDDSGFQGLMDQDQDENTEESDVQESPTEFDIDGEKFKLDQLKELVSKGKDYTKKTMELSEQRKQFEQEQANLAWVKQLHQAWDSSPQSRIEIIEALMKEAGYNPTPQTELGNINLEDISDEGKFLLKENQKLKAQLDHVTRQSAEAFKQFEDYIKESQGASAASVAAANIKDEFGAEVSASELKQLSKDTGIADYEAAWLKVNKDKVKQGLFKAGHQQGSREKPNSPTGQTRTFDPNAKGMTADKILRNLMKGYTPSSK